jgi:hypothetical protein
MKTIVNVAGLRRSGTTLLHLMLASGPDSIACGEIGDWFRLARYRPGARVPTTFTSLKDLPPHQFHCEALDHFEVDFIIDSTKGLEWVIDVNKWAHNQGIRVFNVVIWKDPIDQTYSHWKRGGGGTLPWHYVWYHSRLFRSGLSFFTVSYDELVNDPAKKLRDICLRIGMPYFEGKERFWEEDHRFAGSSPGVRRQVNRGQSKISKEPHPPDFEPIAQYVREEVMMQPKVHRILEVLQKHEVSNLLATACVPSHQYDPSLLALSEHHLWKAIKQPIYRFRWNVVEPHFGNYIRRLRQALRKEEPATRPESFDPDAHDSN